MANAKPVHTPAPGAAAKTALAKPPVSTEKSAEDQIAELKALLAEKDAALKSVVDAHNNSGMKSVVQKVSELADGTIKTDY